MQQLQSFLSESCRDADLITMQTLQLLGDDPLTASAADGVLVIDDTGDRKDGCATDHMARQYLGSVGKVYNGIVAVTTLWANEQRYYPLHVAPYTFDTCPVRYLLQNAFDFLLPGGKQHAFSVISINEDNVSFNIGMARRGRRNQLVRMRPSGALNRQ